MKNKNEKSLPTGRQVAVYDPFLGTLGGGEKYIFSILEVFAEQGFELSIFWDKDLSKKIKDRFSLNFVDKIKWLPNIFGTSLKTLRTLRTIKTLSSFDYFFYVTDGSYFFSGAKNNFIYAMIPDKKLYSKNVINRLKLMNYKFITHSLFTQKWLKKFGIKSTVLMPYLDKKLIELDMNYLKKEKIILSVGRFFSHLHSKRQDLIIKTFKDLKKKSKKFSGYKLILAGGLKSEDQQYFEDLKKISGNDSSIIFKPNINLDELYKLYKLATYFWHFTGYGIDEEKNPELVEHFGITPLEAMASGCLTFCYSAGGPKELIADGKNGFLFNDINELISKMSQIDSDGSLKKEVIKNAKDFVKEEFSYKKFREKILSTFFPSLH